MSDSYEPNNGGDLEGFLSSRPETTTQGYVREGTDNPIVDHDFQNGDLASSDQGFSAPPGGVSRPVAASPPPAPAQPGVSQEEYDAALEAAQQQEQINLALVRQRMELEDAWFESSLAHLDEYSKRYYRNERYLEQFAQANQGQAQRIQQLERAQEMQEQGEAKQKVALVRMLNAGVNLGDKDARNDILSAATSEQMNSRITLWSQVHNMNQQQVAAQATRAQTAAGAYAAAPQRGSSRGGNRSRSLEDYISSKPFVYSE